MLVAAARAGIHEGRFWRLTPFEFSCAVEGHNQAQRETQRLLAWHAANIMQMWTKKKISVGSLLGEKKVVFADVFSTVEEVREYYRQKAARSQAATE